MAIKVFLSWSGSRSRALADAVGPWLRQLVQALDPWVSSGIDKGARWGPEISRQLEETKVGIICLTKDNLTEPWLLFEAGALSKTKDAYVCTLLLDVPHSDIEQPLAQFQHTKADKEDLRALIHTLNTVVQSNGGRALTEADLDELFDSLWPNFEARLKAIPATKAPTKPVRDDGEILREILELVRSGQRPAVPTLAAASETASPRPLVYSVTVPAADDEALRELLPQLVGLTATRVMNTPEGKRRYHLHFDRPGWKQVQNVIGRRLSSAKIKKLQADVLTIVAGKRG